MPAIRPPAAPPVALVLGAHLGPGAAVARRLQRGGWRVVAGAPEQAALQALEGHVELALTLDPADREGLEIGLAAAVDRLGGVDALWVLTAPAAPAELEGAGASVGAAVAAVAGAAAQVAASPGRRPLLVRVLGVGPGAAPVVAWARAAGALGPVALAGVLVSTYDDKLIGDEDPRLEALIEARPAAPAARRAPPGWRWPWAPR